MLIPAAAGAIERAATESPATTAPTTTTSPSPIPTQSPAPTATPTWLPSPAATAAPTATVKPTAAPSLTPTPNPARIVNGVPVEEFVILPAGAEEHIRNIFERGRQLGRNPRAFSKIGDSISLTSHYFARFDQGYYRLGVYEPLQASIDYFDHSFERFGVATRVGLHAWIPFKPGLADPEKCELVESMVACEFRLHNPAVALVRLGTNDTAPGDAYERAIRFAIDYSAYNGVIPVLVTKSDRFEGDNRHNETMRWLAFEYAVPLWDFDRVAATLPNNGLVEDQVHLTTYPSDDFTDPLALTRGYPLSDLTGLMMLDAIRQIIETEENGGLIPTALQRRQTMDN